MSIGKNNTPAVLFYSQDFLAGVAEMTNEEIGAYIKLLAYQNIHGHMSAEYIKRVCPDCPPYVLEKFSVDDAGYYFNERMEKEIEKRNNYSKSRSNNRKETHEETYEEHMKNISSSYEKHMETETEKETETSNKEIMAIVSYLNERTGKSFRASSRATKDKIRARLNEGFTVDDFKRVIDVKTAEWMGTEQEKYLRPETLFGTKFEGYLNQRPERKKMSNADIARAMDEYELMKGGTNEQTRNGHAAGIGHGGISGFLQGGG